MTLLTDLQALKTAIDEALPARLKARVAPSPESLPFVTYQMEITPTKTFDQAHEVTVTLEIFEHQLDICFTYLQHFMENFQPESDWAEERIFSNYIFDFRAYRLSYRFLVTTG